MYAGIKTLPFADGSDSKRICLQCKRLRFNPWVWKIPWRRAWHPTPVFLPGEAHGQRRLVGYSPKGQHSRIWQKQLSVHGHIRSLLSVMLPDAGEAQPQWWGEGHWPQGVCRLVREEVQKTHPSDASTQGSSGGPGGAMCGRSCPDSRGISLVGPGRRLSNVCTRSPESLSWIKGISIHEHLKNYLLFYFERGVSCGLSWLLWVLRGHVSLPWASKASPLPKVGKDCVIYGKRMKDWVFHLWIEKSPK